MLKLAATCAVHLSAVAALHFVADASPGRQGTLYIVAQVVAGAAMLAAWRLARGLEGRGVRHLTLTLVVAGILARIALLGVPAFTTHDVERYLWDGAVARAGLDPWELPPDAPALDGLRDRFPSPTDHTTLPTLYPPLAVALFAAASSTGGSPWLWQITSTLGSLLLLLLAARALRCRADLALIALHPLLIVEAGVGMHLDGLVALALFAAVTARAPFARAVAAGASVLLKLTPVVAIATWIPRAREDRRVALGAALVVVVGYAAATALGLAPLGSLATFLGNWSFGSPVGALTRALLPAPWDRAALLALLCVLLIFLVARARRGLDLVETTTWAFAALLVCSPVVFPWYLAPLVALTALRPRWSLILWSLAIPLTYEVLDDTAAWVPAGWPLIVIGSTWMAGALLDVRSRSRHTRRADAVS